MDDTVSCCKSEKKVLKVPIVNLQSIPQKFRKKKVGQPWTLNSTQTFWKKENKKRGLWAVTWQQKNQLRNRSRRLLPV